MLNKIRLVNFRRHRDLTLTLNNGLMVLRGSNESGKSTSIEAIAYALFGVKALRDSLDDTVTWGEPTSSLKVELDMVLDGVAYNLKRSKAGAELNSDGLRVTGQTEVSAHVGKLLKVDAATAARLSLAQQSEIRGALSAGTKATTELIEKLAEFDQIDHLIEVMQEKLTLGSTAVVEAAIEAAKQALQDAKLKAVPFDEAPLKRAIDSAIADQAVYSDAVKRCEESLTSAQENYTAVRERIARRDAMVRDVEHSAGVVASLKERVENFEVVDVSNLDGRIATLREDLAKAQEDERVASIYFLVEPYLTPAPREPMFEGSIEKLRERIAFDTSEIQDTSLSVTKLEGDLRVLQAKLTHGTCTFCGKDFSGVPEVEARNAQTRAQIEQVQKTCEIFRDQVRVLKAGVFGHTEILNRSQPILKALGISDGRAKLADDILPPTLVWVGDVPKVGTPCAQLKRKISELLNERDTALRNQSQFESLKERLATALKEDRVVQGRLLNTPMESAVNAREVLDVAKAELTAMNTELAKASRTLQDARRSLQNEQDALERAKVAVESSKRTLAERSKELETLQFNNALLKRVRQCRPVIADKLWGIVLAAVSNYFSEIRGAKSRVSKDKDGFKIDDHPISSMSGSTLDALGLAVRVALVRTFLPCSPFLLLDEPCAAMDADRTTNLLGFLSTCGFRQTLVASHEEVSTDIADHVIAL